MKYREDWPSTKRATVLLEEGPQTTVVYHRTPVFTYNRVSRNVQLDSGGHRTKTTKDRINEAFRHFGLPYRVFQKNFDWFVEAFDMRNGEAKCRTWSFVDGMVIGLDPA